MKIVAVYPGRFHPFHKGHAASFKQLAEKFGLPNTLLAISAKQEQPDSPFTAQDRAVMAQELGIPPENILIVRNPYNAMEYADHLQSKGIDPTKTALVFGVSAKDMEDDPRFSFKPTKSGKPSYFQPFTKEATVNLQPMTKGTPGSGHAYVMTTAVHEFPIAGKKMKDASAIRKAYSKGNQRKRLRILHDLYGDSGQNLKQSFDNNLLITENIKALITKIKPLINEATVEQKAKFVELLSEAKNKMNNVDEAANAAQQAAIAINMKKKGKKPKHESKVSEAIGDGFYLIDGEELRFLPEEITYPDKVFNDDDFEQFYNHPEFHKTAAFARQHYPSAPTKQQAFLRFVMRSLMHSEEDDKRQDREIDLLMKRVNSLQNKIDNDNVTAKATPIAQPEKTNTQKADKIDESADYLEEK